MKLRVVVALFVLGITMTAVQCLAEEICGCLKPNSKHARIVDDVSECKRKEVAVVLTVAPTCEGTLSADGRWCDQGDGTIKDMTTGLVWLQDANHFGSLSWQNAINAIDTANAGQGIAGYADWRLPTIKELESLTDYSEYSPALPDGHPFTNVQSGYYWSGTTYASNAGYAWCVYMGGGSVVYSTKTNSHYVWPVRGGND